MAGLMHGAEWLGWHPNSETHQDGLWRALRLFSASHLRSMSTPANLAGSPQTEHTMRNDESDNAGSKSQAFGGASKTPVPAARGNTNARPPKPATPPAPGSAAKAAGSSAPTPPAEGSVESTGTSGSGSSIDQTGRTDSGDGSSVL